MSVSAGAAGISADRLDDEAHVHTLFPVPRGERALAERLVRLSGAETHLWFSVDYLPGVPEIDVVLLHEGIGLFLFEVKAVPHDLIQEYGPARCVIQGRGGTRTPLSQARTATLKLIDFLRAEIDRGGARSEEDAALARKYFRRTVDLELQFFGEHR